MRLPDIFVQLFCAVCTHPMEMHSGTAFCANAKCDQQGTLYCFNAYINTVPVAQHLQQ